jgi:hypothetical protein
MMRLFLKMLADDVRPTWAVSRRLPAHPVGRDERPPAAGERTHGTPAKVDRAQFDRVLQG